MLDLVKKFAAKLPASISQIRRNYEENDRSLLRDNVHDLKGASGNYGFEVFYIKQFRGLSLSCLREIILEAGLELMNSNKIINKLKQAWIVNIVLQIRINLYYFL